jgi:hypothetical protein
LPAKLKAFKKCKNKSGAKFAGRLLQFRISKDLMQMLAIPLLWRKLSRMLKINPIQVLGVRQNCNNTKPKNSGGFIFASTASKYPTLKRGAFCM